MNNRYTNNSKFGFINAVVDCTGLIKGALTTDEKSILLTIWSYLDNETNKSWLTRQQIIDLSGFTCDGSKFRKAYQSVQDKGWLIVERQFNNNNIYTLQVPQDILNVLENHDCIHEPIVQDVRKPNNKKCTFKKYPTVQDVHEGTVQDVHEGTVQDVQSKRKEKENIKENNNNVSNETKTKKLFGGLFSNNEEKEKECHSFTNVQELDTLKENTSKTTNNDNSTLIETYGDIFSFDDVEEEPYYNENECAYENVTDENEHQLSTTELIEMYGTDDNTIQDNPYIRQWIVNEMLSIIDYTTASEKVQDNLNDWLEYHKHLIKYFRRELNKNYNDYEWITDKIDNKNKRLNVMKSRLLKECQEWHDRNSETKTFEVLDDVDVPPFCLY